MTSLGTAPVGPCCVKEHLLKRPFLDSCNASLHKLHCWSYRAWNKLKTSNNRSKLISTTGFLFLQKNMYPSLLKGILTVQKALTRCEGIIIFRSNDMIFVRQFQAAWEVHQMFYTLLSKLHNFKSRQIEIRGRLVQSFYFQDFPAEKDGKGKGKGTWSEPEVSLSPITLYVNISGERKTCESR